MIMGSYLCVGPKRGPDPYQTGQMVGESKQKDLPVCTSVNSIEIAQIMIIIKTKEKRK